MRQVTTEALPPCRQAPPNAQQQVCFCLGFQLAPYALQNLTEINDHTRPVNRQSTASSTASASARAAANLLLVVKIQGIPYTDPYSDMK